MSRFLFPSCKTLLSRSAFLFKLIESHNISEKSQALICRLLLRAGPYVKTSTLLYSELYDKGSFKSTDNDFDLDELKLLFEYILLYCLKTLYELN